MFGLFKKYKSMKDIDKEYEEKYSRYCVECKSKLRSGGMWYCERVKCSRYGLYTAMALPAPDNLGVSPHE